MNGGRYVVLGLAPARTPWFTAVSRWSTVGSLPVEFLKCLSIEDLRARIDSGRPFSAALLDGRHPGIERDLLATLDDHDITSIIVGPADGSRDWVDVGATAELGDHFDRGALLDVLAGHGRLIAEITEEPFTDVEARTDVGWLAPLVSITGRSGAGVSTLAVALAQYLGADPRYSSDVLLSDLARHAHQAVLHDVRDIVPGIQEVMDLHRTSTPVVDEIHRLTYRIPGRGYRLLLGLRHPRNWATIRARTLAAALDSLRRASRIVVADTDPDLDGEKETGSFDIEDRHLLGRRTISIADLIVVVATPTLTGIHGLTRQIEELRLHGVAGERILVALNRAPRGARARAELTRSVGELTGNPDHADPFLGPVFVPERKGVEAAHRDLAPLPTAITDPLGGAVLKALDRSESRRSALLSTHEPEPVAIVPGSLGHREETP